MNNDGFDDVVIGARSNDTPGIQAGRVYLFLGPLSGNRPATSADAIISGDAFEEVGRAVAPAGDLTATASTTSCSGPTSAARPTRGRPSSSTARSAATRTAASADAIINGTFASESLGASVASAGDVNGDGVPDIVVGAPRFPLNGNGTGRAYVFYGPVMGVISAASANATLFGEALNDSFGISVAAGDINGDSDLGRGGRRRPALHHNGTGKAYVFYGPLSGPIQAANAGAILLGEAADDLFGTSVAAGDVNGDGFADAIAGASDQGGGGGRSGRAYVFHGPLSGTIPAGNADFVVTGSSGDEVGHWVSTGDVNDDGVSDTLVGAPQFTSGAPGYAAVFSQGVAAAVAPFALAVDAAGNGVYQPNEMVVVAPTWRNVGTQAIAIDGALTTHTGPAGPTYSIPDAAASYGTIAVGGNASCTAASNCYAVANTTATRPATHWDSTVVETMTPTGTAKTWTLHVGNSFAEVPPSSPFFRFIEMLLHRGVTGGCTATNYCPSASTTREQMAVFVVLSKEPPGYIPPACVAGSEAFADVPASSPFCRWIEELARRGVVSPAAAAATTAPATRSRVSRWPSSSCARWTRRSTRRPARRPTCTATSPRPARSAAGSRSSPTAASSPAAAAATTARRPPSPASRWASSSP